MEVRNGHRSRCGCDPSCPTEHQDTISCGYPAEINLDRFDMALSAEVVAEVRFCAECAEDAIESGVYAVLGEGEYD